MTENDLIERILKSPVWPYTWKETENNSIHEPTQIDYHEQAKANIIQDKILEFFLTR